MKEYNIKVNFETGEIISGSIYLVQNDYNSTKFNIEFDKDYKNYIKKIVIVFPDNTIYQKEIVNNEFVFVEYNENDEIIPLINQQGEYKFNFSLYNGNSKITTTYNSYFYANDDISNGEEVDLDDRVPMLDYLINKVVEVTNDTEEATDYANEKGQYAEEQGAYAEEQGDYAKQQGDNVQQDISDIRTIAEQSKETSERAETIAKGRATGYVFDTLEDLDLWLENSENVSKLVLGDNLYIREVGIPDYWWDGTDKQVLETQKVDLTEYVQFSDYATSSKAGVIKAWTSTNEDGETGLNISTEV